MSRRVVSAVILCSVVCLRVARILTNIARSPQREHGLWHRATIVLGLVVVVALGASAQTPPLNFGNNYFVTGDYVVAGVGLRGLGVNGFATKTFPMPDPLKSVPVTGVPPGADIVAALLYWQTVESSQTTFAGQNGFFRPVISGGPGTGYPISGVVLGNPNAPVSWSSGGCSGNAQGSKTMRTYRADVSAFLPQDSNGNITPNSTYEVSLADSGSNGGGAPLTLGASLVLIYRAITPGLPLNSVVIYDGAFAPANGSSTMSQTLQGFYQAAASPVSKLTHLVGNGQNNKFETVYLNGVTLPSLYGSDPPFPGKYNGSWDNPTWSFPAGANPVHANDASATTMVVPNSQNSGCVSWGAVIVSTTVQSSGDGIVSDGLVDVWKKTPPSASGYCDASVNEGVCRTGDPTDPSWVALPGATAGKKDLFVELDYMVGADTHSHYPPPGALTMMTNAFSPKGINVHFIQGNEIQEPTCTDDLSGNPVVLCPYPNQPGVVGWKAGFEFLKNQPLNYPDELSCETQTPPGGSPGTGPPCVRRFQHGRKDSYHYALFAHALGLPEWSLLGGSLSSVGASGTTVTFITSTPHGLTAGDRVTVTDAITNSSLNGTYMVQTPSDVSFTITIPTATSATYTGSTDPQLSVSSGGSGTASGFSDLGGADSLITLGSWGAAGQTDQVQAGTFMHELGHSNGLPHGGLYYDALPSYVRTFEPNCKPNYQSVMSYLFQVDLLDNGVLDYSEQNLALLNETSPLAGLTPTPLAYSTTKWYTLIQPGGVGTPATFHCDGTPRLPAELMYRVEGTANPITPVVNASDFNFDGTININAPLRGYNDWANLDLRQIGATGSDIAGAGGTRIGTGTTGGGGTRIGTGTTGGGGTRIGTGTTGGGGTGHGEITFATANSSVRPPRFLTATLTPLPRYIQLNWTAPTFGQIASYNIYRATNGIPAPLAIANVAGNTLTYTDKNVTCGPTYTYFVTAKLSDGRESVPSNSVSLTDCAPPYRFTGFYTPLATADPPNTNSYSGTSNLGKSVTAKWTLQDSSGNYVTNLNANTLYGIGPFQPQPTDGTCRPSQVSVVAGCSANNSCPANASTLYSPTTGAKGNSTFRFSTNQFVFNWDTKTTTAGCYVLELDLDSGQVERTGLKLQ
jgi:hypothetical protein